MIKPWLFEFFHSVHDPAGHDDPETVHDHYRKYFDLWVGDEARGFEGIFFSEHHFGPGYSPSPNLLISHLAARTSTMRLGVLGSVAAYSTPWRVAEEFAMLDHLTNGRLEMGVVSGIPPELALTGITVPRAAELHAEVLDVLQAAVTKPVVSHSGAHFSFDELRMTPTFLQPSPSIWTASTSEASAQRGGRARVEDVRRLQERHHARAAVRGVPGGGTLGGHADRTRSRRDPPSARDRRRQR